MSRRPSDRKRSEARSRTAAEIITYFLTDGDADLANVTEAASHAPLEAQAMMYALARQASFLAEQVEEATGTPAVEAVGKALERATLRGQG